jgi:DNA polymerase III subunit gamma/tau
VGRCQRFDFRRLTLDDLAAHLEKVAASEGQSLEASAALAIARQAEGSARDALSLLDQAGVIAGATIDDDVVRTLLGAPRGEVQHELADAVAVGDAKAVFEIVGRLVQDGQDLRNVTAEALTHFRNLLLVKTAPGQRDLVDVPDDAYETLRIQAERFTPGELSRVLALLLAAQNDMRWTTSPRLSLELALVRSTMPETDADPSALVTRLERLERLANLEPGAVVPTPADAAPSTTPKSPADDVEPVGGTIEPAAGVEPAEEPPRSAPPSEHKAEQPEPAQQMPVPHAADAASVDVALLRRSWQSLLQHLSSNRQMILAAILESATPASYDGSTLELAFPPDRGKVGPQKVEGKKTDLQAAIGDVFGVRPEIVCVVREVRDAGGPSTIEIVEDDEVVDEAEALKRVQEMLGAQVSGDAEGAE